MDSNPIINDKRCYCGPLGITLGDLCRKTKTFPLSRQKNNRTIYYTHKGRCGLALLCHHWNLKENDEVLIPAYNCGTEVDPFIKFGLNVVFYRIDQNAKIDLNDLRRKITPRTKVIYITHYFGWPQDIQVLPDFCKNNNIYLIEDCALSLFSEPVDLPIGILGDAAIYSLPKSLPVPDGGVLTTVNHLKLANSPFESPPIKVIFKNLLPLVKRTTLRLIDKIGLYRYCPKRLIQKNKSNETTSSNTSTGLPNMPLSYYYDKNIQNKVASSVTRHILHRTCWKSVVNQRRKNYLQLFQVVEKSSLFKPLYPQLTDGVCPLYLPVIVENCHNICLRLNEMGISAIQWWAGFHQAFDWNEFPEARYLKSHLLAIPIHQQLLPGQINYISKQLQKIDQNF